MTTKTKTPPLTRKERRILKEARGYGLTTFGNHNDLTGQKTATQSLEGMTTGQRNYYFNLIEDFCILEETLRGEN